MDLQGRANSVSQVDGVSDMASMSVGSVALWGRVQRKDNAFLSGRKLSPSSCMDARHFSVSLYATVAFQAATLVMELRGSELE